VFGRPGKAFYGAVLLGAAGAGLALRERIGRTLDVIDEGIRVPVGSPSGFKIAAALGYAVGPLLALWAGWQGLRGLARGDRFAISLVVVAGLPLLALGLLSPFYSVGIWYYYAAAPAVLLLAAAGLVRLRTRRGTRSCAMVTTFLCLSQVPLVVSDQIDGQRYDYKGAAARLAELTTAEDFIVVKGHGYLEYYLDRPTQELAYVVPWLEYRLRGSGREEAYLLLQSQRGQLIFPGVDIESWLARHARLVETFGCQRWDSFFYRFELKLYVIDVGSLPEASQE